MTARDELLCLWKRNAIHMRRDLFALYVPGFTCKENFANKENADLTKHGYQGHSATLQFYVWNLTLYLDDKEKTNGYFDGFILLMKNKQNPL